MTRQILFVLMLLLSMVAKAQSADALYEEGKDLYDAKKYEQAFKKLLPAAQKGHKKAQYRVGRCYDKGHGVTEDNQKAYQWYLKASQQGHGKSQYQLAKCYLKAMQNDKAKEKYKEDVADGDETAIALKKLIGK